MLATGSGRCCESEPPLNNLHAFLLCSFPYVCLSLHRTITPQLTGLFANDCAHRMIAFLLPAVQIRTLHGLRHAAAASDAVVVICLLVILVKLAISSTPVRFQL